MMPVRRSNQTWLPSIFNDFFDNDWMVKANATAPAINVIESDKDYKVEVAAPGMTKEDFKIHINEDNDLVISMEKKTESTEGDKEGKKESRYLRREFSYSKFQQALILPDDVEKDKINANVTDGVLTIELPKRTPEEKAKINRVIDRELPDASKEKLLVLDATTGQNAVNQAEQFRQATGITGIVLTKLDGTAKGGVVLAIKDGLGIPVKYIGVGEQIDDLQPFNPDAFADALFSIKE